jgi:hypothetical protein
LVLVDDEDRKYFKQTEIIIYRKPQWLCYIDLEEFIWMNFYYNTYAIIIIPWKASQGCRRKVY